MKTETLRRVAVTANIVAGILCFCAALVDIFSGDMLFGVFLVVLGHTNLFLAYYHMR